MAGIKYKGHVTEWSLGGQTRQAQSIKVMPSTVVSGWTDTAGIKYKDHVTHSGLLTALGQTLGQTVIHGYSLHSAKHSDTQGYSLHSAKHSDTYGYSLHSAKQ